MFPGLWHRSIGPMVHEVATFSKPRKRCLSHGTACQSLSIFCIQNSQVLVFGTPRDNHNMGKGRHSPRHLSLFVFGPIGSGKYALLNVFIVFIFQISFITE
jgi:hypothetical protein